MSKKYYWLKLRDDFFTQPRIKKLRRIAGGDTYTIIYLKLQLLSLKNGGELFFENIEDDIIEELALQIDEEVDNVKITFNFLINQGLVELVDDKVEMIETKGLIGKETDSAERVRKHRSRLEEQKALHCNTLVTICNTEKEIDKEIEKEKDIKPKKNVYGEFKNVKLTDDEYKKLEEKGLLKEIENLDSYIESKGAKYKNHYATILVWDKKNKGVKNAENKSEPERKKLSGVTYL